MKTLMERIFGLSWRTTITGVGSGLMAFLAGFAALPYTLGTDALLVPPEWKAPLFKACAIASLILKILNSIFQKDKQVSGTPATTQLVGSTPETLRAIPPEPSPDDKRPANDSQKGVD